MRTARRTRSHRPTNMKRNNEKKSLNHMAFEVVFDLDILLAIILGHFLCCPERAAAFAQWHRINGSDVRSSVLSFIHRVGQLFMGIYKFITLLSISHSKNDTHGYIDPKAMRILLYMRYFSDRFAARTLDDIWTLAKNKKRRNEIETRAIPYPCYHGYGL